MKRALAIALGMAGVTLLTAGVSRAVPPIPVVVTPTTPPPAWATWTLSSAIPPTSGVYSGSSYPIAFLNGRFVASGVAWTTATTSLATSPDGSTWSQPWSVRLAGTANNQMALQALAYNQGQYIAGFRSGALEVSPDGATWTAANYNLKQPIFSAASGGGRCVLGTTGVVLTSTDKTMLNWTIVGLPNQNNGVLGLAYGNGMFVAVTGTGCAGCGDNTGGIYTSTDGLTWSTAVATTKGLISVAYGNRGFIGVGWNGVSYSSPDGVTWSGPTTIGAGTLSGIAYGNGVYVAVGFTGGSPGASVLYTTQTGTTAWTARTLTMPAGVPPLLSTVAFGDNRFVAYAMGGAAWTSGVLPSTPTAVPTSTLGRSN